MFSNQFSSSRFNPLVPGLSALVPASNFSGRLLVGLLLCFGITSSAVAEETPWTTGFGVGSYFFEGDEEFNPSVMVEGKVGYDISDKFTFETGVGYLPYVESSSGTSSDPKAWHLDSTQALRGGVDLLYQLDDKDATWRKHLALTGGVMYFNNSRRDGGHFDPFGGLGAGMGYAINKKWQARGDYRVVASGSHTEINHQALLSVFYRWSAGSRETKGSSITKEVPPQLPVEKEELELRTIYFDYDESLLTPQAKEKLGNNAGWLRENPSRRITLEGHCDERGTVEYNVALGERRAKTAYEYLRSLGVDASRMDLVSYGEERPVDPASNEEAWAKNRRVVCVPQ